MDPTAGRRKLRPKDALHLAQTKVYTRREAKGARRRGSRWAWPADGAGRARGGVGRSRRP